MGRRTDPAVREYVAEICRGRRCRVIAAMVNEKFGTHYTAKCISSNMKNWGLHNGLPRYALKGERPRLFPPEIVAWIRASSPGVGIAEMTEMVNGQFGTSYTRQQIKGLYGREKISSGLTGRFRPGSESWNKGKSVEEILSPEALKIFRGHQFPKGNRPRNTAPIGHERVIASGYVQVKVRERFPGEYGNGNFRFKHHLVWEQHNGPIPEGCCVVFRDGNKQNCAIESLALITRAQNAVLNKNHLRSNPDPALFDTALLTAELMAAKHARRKTRERKEENE